MAPWGWNGSDAALTLTPSVRVSWGEGGRVCHFYVTGGRVQFLADSTHLLANQTVALERFRNPYPA